MVLAENIAVERFDAAYLAEKTAECEMLRSTVKLLEDQLRRTQGYEAGIVGELVAKTEQCEVLRREVSRAWGCDTGHVAALAMTQGSVEALRIHLASAEDYLARERQRAEAAEARMTKMQNGVAEIAKAVGLDGWEYSERDVADRLRLWIVKRDRLEAQLAKVVSFLGESHGSTSLDGLNADIEHAIDVARVALATEKGD